MGGLMGNIDIDNIDLEKLRSVLKDYFETGKVCTDPFFKANVLNIDNVNDYMLVGIAIENGFNLNDYKKDISR